jgi:hypothetical protein
MRNGKSILFLQNGRTINTDRQECLSYFAAIILAAIATASW